MKAMETMCDSCPFGNTDKQSHMRRSLRWGRFNEICQSVFRGFIFACHKTTTHDDEEGEWVPTQQDRECAGAISFREAAIANREKAQRRAEGVSQ
jgi:hypothetical protein